MEGTNHWLYITQIVSRGTTLPINLLGVNPFIMKLISFLPDAREKLKSVEFAYEIHTLKLPWDKK